MERNKSIINYQFKEHLAIKFTPITGTHQQRNFENSHQQNCYKFQAMK